MGPSLGKPVRGGTEKNQGGALQSRERKSSEAGNLQAQILEPDTLVRVAGLTSTNGSKLNGLKGVVVSRDTVKERDGQLTEFYEVRLESGVLKKLRRCNLVNAPGLESGVKVRVVGLTSTNGSKLNGVEGVVVSGGVIRGDVQLTEFYEVCLENGVVKKLQSCNLVKASTTAGENLNPARADERVKSTPKSTPIGC
jgi:predicted DNA-binding antitoxin AbrB/MazE fold protein